MHKCKIFSVGIDAKQIPNYRQNIIKSQLGVRTSVGSDSLVNYFELVFPFLEKHTTSWSSRPVVQLFYCCFLHFVGFRYEQNFRKPGIRNI